MTNGEEQARQAAQMTEALACPGAGPTGDSRTPQFGDWLRGIWASEKNPQRDGRYVRTVRRTGRVNRGTFYELTDGRGRFWEYPASSTVFIQAPADGVALGDPAYRNCEFCGCLTNAKVRACCENGHAADRYPDGVLGKENEHG